MIKFVNNNALLILVKMISFFVNMNFYSRISFSLNFTLYILTRERLQIIKIKVITNSIKKTLKIIIIKVKVVKDIIIIQVNKHRKKVIYKKDNIIFLFNQNIKTIKSINKLKDKMLSLFQVKQLIETLY